MTILTKGQKIFMHVNAIQEFIKDPVNIELKENDPNAYEDKISTNFKQLKEKYDIIYKIATSKVFEARDYAILKMMLDKKDRIDNKEISEEDASKEIGQNLYNTYVNPFIDKDIENQ
jgi:hypothetical protein